MPEKKPTPTEHDNHAQPATTVAELHDHRIRPEGVVPKQSQSYVIAGLAVLILLAVLFSNNRAKTIPKPSPAIPMPATEVNQRKIEDLKRDLTEVQRQSEQSQKASAAATGFAAGAGGSQNANPQPTSSTEPPRDPIQDAERALTFKSRFASNLVTTAGAEQSTLTRASATGRDEEPARRQETEFGTEFATKPETEFETKFGTKPGDALRWNNPHPLSGQPATGQAKRPSEVNVNSATGHPYVLFEGTMLDTVLVNRLDGEFSGPVKVMVTNPVYSQDRQHVLIAEGTFLLGGVQKVSGFGQKRLAVAFHRMLMPDGYSVDLDRFHGLDQAGETGLKDRANNHYLEIFGTSIALGVIAGAAEGTTNSGSNQTGSDRYRQGVASSVAQSSATVLDRFLNIPPTITIREGHRIKVYLTQDLLLPAYENHTVPPNI